MRGMTTLSVRLIDVDDRRAKAAIHGLNQTGRRPHELEEAWIVQALVREDGLSQAEVAELLGRHKSWVCRRLALLEKLCTGCASGPGSRAIDPDRRARDRPVAGRQPIGSGGCNAAGGAQRRRACRRGPPASGVGDGRAEDVRAGQAPTRRWDRPARRSPRAGTPGSAPAAIASASSWRCCWTGWPAWRTSWNATAGPLSWRPIAWSWARSSSGSHATQSAWRTGPVTWPWRCSSE